MLLRGILSGNLSKFQNGDKMLINMKLLGIALLMALTPLTDAMDHSSSNLPTSSLCVPNNASCSHEKTLNERCEMIYYPPNSVKCADMIVEGDYVDMKHLALGSFILNSYLYQDRAYTQTGINMTFYDIKWVEMQIRITQDGYPEKNMCRQFERTPFPTYPAFFYDCLWDDHSYEGRSITMEYAAKHARHMEKTLIHFNIPHKKLISREIPLGQRELLLYVQVLLYPWGFYHFSLSWPGVEDTEDMLGYRVFIYQDNATYTHLVDGSECSDEKDLCTFTTSMWSGRVSFGVQLVMLSDPYTAVSKTKEFDLGSPIKLPNMWALILVLIILYACFGIYSLLKKRLEKKCRSLPPVKMLLVFSPTTELHIHVVEEIADYLNHFTHITAIIADLNTAAQNSKDPFDWCVKALEETDVVCVVASPFYRKIEPVSSNYRIDELMMCLIHEYYDSYSEKQFCLLNLPYTTRDDEPLEAETFIRLNFPADLTSLLLVHHFEWVPSWMRPMVMGGTLDFKRLGRNVTALMRGAEEDLKINRDFYLEKIYREEGSKAQVKQWDLGKEVDELREVVVLPHLGTELADEPIEAEAEESTSSTYSSQESVDEQPTLLQVEALCHEEREDVVTRESEVEESNNMNDCRQNLERESVESVELEVESKNATISSAVVHEEKPFEGSGALASLRKRSYEPSDLMRVKSMDSLLSVGEGTQWESMTVPPKNTPKYDRMVKPPPYSATVSTPTGAIKKIIPSKRPLPEKLFFSKRWSVLPTIAEEDESLLLEKEPDLLEIAQDVQLETRQPLQPITEEEDFVFLEKENVSSDLSEIAQDPQMVFAVPNLEAEIASAMLNFDDDSQSVPDDESVAFHPASKSEAYKTVDDDTSGSLADIEASAFKTSNENSPWSMVEDEATLISVEEVVSASSPIKEAGISSEPSAEEHMKPEETLNKQ